MPDGSALNVDDVVVSKIQDGDPELIQVSPEASDVRRQVERDRPAR